jgi:Lon protease-like protein
MADHRNGSSRRAYRLPLFPLRTVLFPGGVLPLKVFEQRYVALAKRCLQEDTPFGVCLILQGEEVAGPGGPQVEFADLGTLARITSVDVPELGILHVATRGESRFQVQSKRAEPDGLFTAEVLPIAPEPRVPLREAHAPLVRLLELMAGRVGPQHFPDGVDYDDSSWVGYRLAELLPLPLSIKQSMLEINDATIRVDVLQGFLAKQGLI